MSLSVACFELSRLSAAWRFLAIIALHGERRAYMVWRLFPAEVDESWSVAREFVGWVDFVSVLGFDGVCYFRFEV